VNPLVSFILLLLSACVLITGWKRYAARSYWAALFLFLVSNALSGWVLIDLLWR